MCYLSAWATLHIYFGLGFESLHVGSSGPCDVMRPANLKIRPGEALCGSRWTPV